MTNRLAYLTVGVIASAASFVASGGLSAFENAPASSEELRELEEISASTARLRAATDRLDQSSNPFRTVRWLIGTPDLRIDLDDDVREGDRVQFQLEKVHGVTGAVSRRVHEAEVSTDNPAVCQVHPRTNAGSGESFFTLVATRPEECTIRASLRVADGVIRAVNTFTVQAQDQTSDQTPVDNFASEDEVSDDEVLLIRSDGSQVGVGEGDFESATEPESVTVVRTSHSVEAGFGIWNGPTVGDSVLMTQNYFYVWTSSNRSQPVTLISNSPEVCSLGSEIGGDANRVLVALVNTGTCTITASHPGDNAYEPASETVSVTVTD